MKLKSWLNAVFIVCSNGCEKFNTLPTGAVAKYCDEHVCLCVCLSVFLSVCLSARISLEPEVQSLPIFLCMLPMAVARSSSGRVTKSQEDGAILGAFFPTDHALYSIAFWIHTKKADLIDMLFGMVSVLGPRNSVLCGGDDARRGKGNLGENVLKKPNTQFRLLIRC